MVSFIEDLVYVKELFLYIIFSSNCDNICILFSDKRIELNVQANNCSRCARQKLINEATQTLPSYLL